MNSNLCLFPHAWDETQSRNGNSRHKHSYICFSINSKKKCMWGYGTHLLKASTSICWTALSWLYMELGTSLFWQVTAVLKPIKCFSAKEFYSGWLHVAYRVKQNLIYVKSDQKYEKNKRILTLHSNWKFMSQYNCTLLCINRIHTVFSYTGVFISCFTHDLKASQPSFFAYDWKHEYTPKFQL
jgi:hypothetical protein